MRFNLHRELSRFLSEDIRTGDVTGALLPKRAVSARIISRQSGVAAGVRFAGEIFALKKCRVSVRTRDGAAIRPNQTIMTVSGNPRHILACERTALNLMSRMSGIATQTSALASKLPRGVGLFATRKTAPGLRAFDKEAVRIGGGKRHRMGLDDAIMIKDNHLAVVPSIGELLGRAKKRGRVEIEVETKADAITAAQNGADIIMLDNFTPAQITSTVGELKRLGLRKRVKIEASGRITGRNIGRYAKTGVDMISSGSITNSVSGIDFSLEIASGP